MSTHFPFAVRAAVSRAPRAARAPLLPGALALIGGILVGEAMAPGGGHVGWAVSTAAAAAALLPLLLLPRAWQQRDRLARIGLLAGAGLLGFAAHQVRTHLPRDHVAHLATDAATLTRVVARVVTPALVQPAQRRNPYLARPSSARTRVIVESVALTTEPESQPIRGLIAVTIDSADVPLAPGALIELSGWLRRPAGARNPGAVDWAAQTRLRGIHAQMHVLSAEHVRRVAGNPPALQSWREAMRQTARRALLDPLDGTSGAEDTSALLDALVLGQRSVVPRALDEAFIAVGAVHYLSVSGFHVGVLATCVWFTLRRVCGASERTAALLVALTLVGYALIAETGAPILRATIMGLCATLATLLYRPLSVVNWLALSAALVLLCNPLDLFTPGFQLSFGQVAGLCAAGPLLQRAVRGTPREDRPRDVHTAPAALARRLLRWAAALLLASIVAWIAALPLVAWHFGQVQPYGAIGSWLLAPLVGFIVCIGMPAAVVGALWPAAGAWLSPLLDTSVQWLSTLVTLLARLPGASISIAPPAPALVFVSMAALAAVAWLLSASQRDPPGGMRRARGLRIAGAAVLACAIGGAWWGSTRTPAAHPELCVLAVGDGSAAILRTAHRASIFDAGTAADFDCGALLVRALGALRVSAVDRVIVSHSDLDHYSGVPRILRDNPRAMLASNHKFAAALAGDAALERLRRDLPANHARVESLAAGARVSLPAGTLRVLWPPADRAAELSDNDGSLVLQIEINNVRVLLPGDIEAPAQRALLDAHHGDRIDLRSEILVAPHHGAVLPAVTREFYAAVAPRLVIVSASRPRPKLDSLIREVRGDACRLLETCRTGAIRVRFPGAGAFVAEHAGGLQSTGFPLSRE